MSVADLAALVKSVGTTQASRITGLARGTIYGIVTGYGRANRARKSTALPTRGAAARPEVAARLQNKVALVVLYARAIVVRADDETGELVADEDPVVCAVDPGDAFEEERDRPFTGMYFRQQPPATMQQIADNLDEYVLVKQAALEQAEDRPARPFVVRKRQAVVVDNLGSKGGAVIVAYLFRFWHEPPGGKGPSPQHETVWTRPSGAVRAGIADIVGKEKLALAEAVYERLRPGGSGEEA